MGWPKKKTLLVPTPQLPEEETCQAKLRAAVFNGIGEQDVAEVIANLVASAKKGDSKSIELLFKHVLAAPPAPQSLVQNNYYGEEGEKRAAKQRGRLIKGQAGADRLSVLRARAESGEELFDDAEDPA